MPQWTGPLLVQVMACRPIGAKPLPEPLLAYCQLYPWEQISLKFESQSYHFHSRKYIWICRLQNWRSFCPGRMSKNPQISWYCPCDLFLYLVFYISWWRHQMETFSALLAFCAGNSPVTGEFPTQRPVTRSFYVFFDLRLNQQLSKRWKRRWFETPSCSLWRHCNVTFLKWQSKTYHNVWNTITKVGLRIQILLAKLQ